MRHVEHLYAVCDEDDLHEVSCAECSNDADVLGKKVQQVLNVLFLYELDYLFVGNQACQG